MLMAVGFAGTAIIQFEDDTIDQQEQLLDRNCYFHDTLILENFRYITTNACQISKYFKDRNYRPL